jgi:hypothetical protein
MTYHLKSILQTTKYEELYDMLIDAHFISTKKGKTGIVLPILKDGEPPESEVGETQAAVQNTPNDDSQADVDNNPNDDSVPHGGMKNDGTGTVPKLKNDGECQESDVVEAPVTVENKPNDDSSVPHGGMKNDGTAIVQKLKNDGKCQESDVVEAPVAVENKPNDDIMPHGVMKVDENVIVQKIKKDVEYPESDIIKTLAEVEHKPNSDLVEGGAETENKKNDDSVLATAMAGESQIIGYECSLLLEDLKNIPEDHIKSHFLRPNRTIFLERIDFNLETQKNIEHWVKNIHARYSNWRNVRGKHLPERVAVPHNCIGHLFKCNWKDGEIMFRVHKIEGDGNCLYRSLAESPLMKTKIPEDVQRRHKYIRLQLQEFAKHNFTFTNFVWKNHGKSPQTTDPRLLQDAYNQWIETLSMNKTWGGPAEYILFAYCFEIHVVCIRQLVDHVDVFSTHEFKWKSHMSQLTTLKCLGIIIHT